MDVINLNNLITQTAQSTSTNIDYKCTYTYQQSLYSIQSNNYTVSMNLKIMFDILNKKTISKKEVLDFKKCLYYCLLKMLSSSTFKYIIQAFSSDYTLSTRRPNGRYSLFSSNRATYWCVGTMSKKLRLDKITNQLEVRSIEEYNHKNELLQKEAAEINMLIDKVEKECIIIMNAFKKKYKID